MSWIEAFERFCSVNNTLLKPDEIPPELTFGLGLLYAHSSLEPRVVGLVILFRLFGRKKALAIRINSSEYVCHGLRRCPSVGDEVSLSIGFGWVFGTPDVHGRHVAYVDDGAGPDRGRQVTIARVGARKDPPYWFDGHVQVVGISGWLNRRAGDDSG